MAKREKDVDMPRRGNFKGGFGQTSATGGAKKKNAPVGMGAKPKPKPVKTKIGAGAKPKPKPARKADTSERTREAAPSYKRTADLGGGPRKKPAKENSTKSRTSKQDRSGSMVLGQGRNSPAAKKLKRTVGYGR